MTIEEHEDEMLALLVAKAAKSYIDHVNETVPLAVQQYFTMQAFIEEFDGNVADCLSAMKSEQRFYINNDKG